MLGVVVTIIRFLLFSIGFLSMAIRGVLYRRTCDAASVVDGGQLGAHRLQWRVESARQHQAQQSVRRGCRRQFTRRHGRFNFGQRCLHRVVAV